MAEVTTNLKCCILKIMMHHMLITAYILSGKNAPTMQLQLTLMGVSQLNSHTPVKFMGQHFSAVSIPSTLSLSPLSHSALYLYTANKVTFTKILVSEVF